WFNIVDPAFNLHLRDEGVARVFSVRKPTDDGIVTSIEAFDALDRNILLMFGARKPGKPELEEWRTLVAGIEKRAAS
ncbi:ChuX/HutX family heme-like substrate-binding protein, partial [Reyranella sp.]